MGTAFIYLRFIIIDQTINHVFTIQLERKGTMMTKMMLTLSK